jgi:hypothetical protein
MSAVERSTQARWKRVFSDGLLARVFGAALPEKMEREIILVDDCSTDSPREILTTAVLFGRTRRPFSAPASPYGRSGTSCLSDTQ